MSEITASQIKQAGAVSPLLVVIHANTSCRVGEYPLQQWQAMADTVQRRGGRFMVVTERYDAYAPLQAVLTAQSISYPIVVLSGAHYGDNDDKVSAQYWKEMLDRPIKSDEYLGKESQLMVFRKSATPRFVPAIGFLD